MLTKLWIPCSGEDFAEEVKRTRPGRMVLVEPKKSDIMLLLEKTNVDKIIIIRESNYFYSPEEGMASPASAFVDLYFEATRDRIPFMETDLQEMMKLFAHNDMINYSVLLRYAHERRVEGEVRAFLDGLAGWVELPGAGLELV